MRRLFTDRIDGDKIIFTGDDHKHISYSLRMKRGDVLTVCCNGIDYAAVIRDITKTEVVAEITGKTKNISEPDTEITLFFGALKGDKNDYIVQKCTELGVKKFIPFVSSFSSVMPQSVRTERLNRISLEAAKQCGRGYVPPVEDVVGFNEMLDMLKSYDLIVFPYEHEEKQDIGGFLSASARGKTAVVVGSEGGFSAQEAERLRGLSGGSVTLGARILRADTACVAVVSVVMYELGEWRNV